LIVLQNKNSIFFDCDDTLVMWDNKHKNFDESNCVVVTDPIIGFCEALVPHDEHIRILKEYKRDGKTIVVWSAGGWEWAKAVVEALWLEDFVDAVMEKPMAYVDDLNCVQFMGTRIYKDMK
jgi:FMN phosphatase YigB (HAD superfamily)